MITFSAILSKAISSLLAYVLADVLAAFYHVLTDKGWNIASQLKQFRNHHDKPETMTFDWEPLLAGIPFCLIGWYFGCYFILALGIFLSLAQIPHYYTHHPAPKPIRFLQRIRLILSVKQHNSHHTEPFDKDYCVLSGWNNCWINYVAKFIPTRKEK